MSLECWNISNTVTWSVFSKLVWDDSRYLRGEIIYIQKSLVDSDFNTLDECQ